MQTVSEATEAILVKEDARALQQRLYREIGLAAVADALALPADAPTSISARHSPAMLVGEQKAA